LTHPVELVNLRLGARAPAELRSIDISPASPSNPTLESTNMPELGLQVPAYERAGLSHAQVFYGPCILTEPVATTWIRPGWMVTTDHWGNLLLQQSS
jgi:N-methylhydantoinase A